MNLWQRATASLRAQGLGATLAKLRTMFVDWWFDLRQGVDTCANSELSELTIDSANKTSGYLYKPVRILPLRKFFAAIRPALPRDAVLVDFGSGKARVLLVAAEFGFREARGVEFARELCEVSRNNCARYRARTQSATRFETIEADAAKYAIRPEENVFILCNPFDDSIVRAVLDNLAASGRECPRALWVAYYNPKWGAVIEQRPDFVKEREFDFWGHRFALYSHQPRRSGHD